MINLFYAGNVKVFDGLLISLMSMSKHTKEELNVYLLTMDLKELNADYLPITDEQVAFLESIIKKSNSNSKITKIDVTKQYHDRFDNTVNKNTRCTPYTLLRLLAPHLDLPDKIIYLDADTIINNDIKELFDIDVENYEAGVVRDIIFKNFVGFFNYFNAGVMLLNLKRIRESGAFDKAAKLCVTKKLAFADQDALNSSIKKRLMIPYKFNWFRKKCKYYDWIVVHHLCNARETGNTHHRIKPWHTELFVQSFPEYKDLINEFIETKKLFSNK
ncbi:MAG TPA: hypothetical protein DCO89_01120 [Clostridiales bacterium]|nr:hypothetical protein [Clostridiales bacterium]